MNIVLVSLVPAVFLIGLALAYRLKRDRPEVYARFAAEPSSPPSQEPAAEAAPVTATAATTV